MSRGVNLQRATNVVHLDSGGRGDATTIMQRNARAARRGNTAQVVTVHHAAVTGTCDAWATQQLHTHLEHRGDTPHHPGDDVVVTAEQILACSTPPPDSGP